MVEFLLGTTALAGTLIIGLVGFTLLAFFAKTVEDAMEKPFFERLRGHLKSGSPEVLALTQQIRKIKMVRYLLVGVGVVLLALLPFLEASKTVLWTVFFALLIAMNSLERRWRKLIREGVAMLS